MPCSFGVHAQSIAYLSQGQILDAQKVLFEKIMDAKVHTTHAKNTPELERPFLGKETLNDPLVSL